MTVASDPRRARRWRALAAAASTILLGCETLVGIHDSRDPPASGGGAIEGGDDARSSSPGSDAAASGPGDSTPVPTSVGSVSANEEGPLGQLAPGGLSGGSPGSMVSAPPDSAPPDDGAPPDDDGAAPVDAGVAVANPPDESEPGTTDEPPPPPPPSPDEVTCSPQPLSPERAGTVFSFTAGPNGGRPGAMGSCAFPNSELPRTPRYYGSVDPELMGTAALCGACMRVSDGVSSVEVTIIDVIEPLPLAHGHTLAIDADAKRVLSTSSDNLDVRFSIVPCTGADTIRLEFASPGDPAVLVLGHENPLQAVQLSTPTTSVALQRQAYNYWKPPAGFALNGSRVTLTLTDVAGSQVTVPDLLVEGSVIETGKQFPLPGCPDSAP